MKVTGNNFINDISYIYMEQYIVEIKTNVKVTGN